MNESRKDQPNKGETIPGQGETQQRVPRMPHERDESASSQTSGEPTATSVGQAAHDDVERGVMDTSRGAEVDQAYDKVRGGADSPEKKFRP